MRIGDEKRVLGDVGKCCEIGNVGDGGVDEEEGDEKWVDGG